MQPGNFYKLSVQIFLVIFIYGFYVAAEAQQQSVERGRFILYKYQQPMGAENYEIIPEGDALTLKTNFELSFIGGRVPVAATLKVRKTDYTPLLFESKGSTSTRTEIDTKIEIAGAEAVIRSHSETRTEKIPGRFFTIAHPAPIAPQLMLFRYWQRNNIKEALPIFPGGTAKIKFLGQDRITAGGRDETLSRYCIEGVMWGCESVWFDRKQNLVALVGADAEMDRFEAVREGYESSLPFFVSKGAEDAVKQLEELSGQIKPLQKDKYAITGALLVDGRGGEPISDSIVLIENGRITAVGKQTEIKIPKGFGIIEARGKTLLPGLWDTHVHATQAEWFPVSLAAGVTTVRDAANELEFIVPIRDAIKSERLKVAPRLLLAGYIDSGANPLGKMKADTPEEARRIVGEYKRAGFEQIKIYQSLKPELIKVVADEAHKLGMTVTGHVPTGVNIYEAVENGFDQINHLGFVYPAMLPRSWKPSPGSPRPEINPESEAAKEGLAFLRENKTVIEPTLARTELTFHFRSKPFATVEPGMAKLPFELKALIESMGIQPDPALEERRRQRDILSDRVILALHKNGIPIIVGTDLTVPGHSEFREIELLVKAGFTPMEAIQAATIVPAKAMKLDKDLGTIETGKLADLIIVDGNPLRSISEIRKVKFVITKGRMYDTADLWRSVGFLP